MQIDDRTDQTTIELLGLSLRQSPPLPDPICPTYYDRITQDPEQYSKPKRVSVMFVMPALPGPKAPSPTSSRPWAPSS